VLAARLGQIDWSRSGLFVLGLGLMLLGLARVPGSTADAPLTVLGAGVVAVSLLLGQVKSIDFGGVLKGEFVAEGGSSSTGVHADEWKLCRFAWLVCGNVEEARELVEEALAEARARRVPAGERGMQELRSLVAMLENTHAHALLRRRRTRHERRHGHDGVDELADERCRATVEALAGLPVRVRVVYLLRCSWLLTVPEVSAILAVGSPEVNDATERAREALAAVQ